MVSNLPFDIILVILENLPLPSASSSYSKDEFQEGTRGRNALYCCSLANRDLSEAAGMILYRSVNLHINQEVESSWTGETGKLPHTEENENENDLPPTPHPLLSLVSYPDKLHKYVRNLLVTGSLSMLTPGPTTNRLPALLATAIRILTSGSECILQTIRFIPERCHPGTFVESLKFAFDDEEKVRILAQIGSMSPDSGLMLRKITLENPTRILLQMLGGRLDGNAEEAWLLRLQGNLLELHLTNNCGSITPGVLNSFVPYFHNLESFSIGISYSLEDKDVFAALSKLDKLKIIKVRWYLQLNSPPPSVFIEEWPLIALEVLEVGFSSHTLRVVLPPDFDPNHTHYWEPILSPGNALCPLCTWVAKVTAGSPKLRDVVFINEDDDDEEDSVDDYGESEDENVDEDEVDRVMHIMSMMRDMSIREVGLGLEERIVEEDDQ
ncbi:hypothetical protein BDP27DRAFT_1359508 [Rhodocollybia butyracea]|uniref:Uncharacterized protein n=1 Tax=Rhodocollybia butyracea TaxID=206335 RepID=A0A9P5Q4D9_9AGAR|nr:hypothetical protein BDP27DRAFT_1359508 [Rhodocollybia butyracea]